MPSLMLVPLAVLEELKQTELRFRVQIHLGRNLILVLTFNKCVATWYHHGKQELEDAFSDG